MKKIKIIVFLTKLGGGGAERVMLNLLNHLPSHSYVKKLIILSKKQSSYLSLLDPNIDVIELNKERLRNSFWALRNVLKDEKPDIVLTTLFDNNFMLALIKLSLFLRRKKFKLVTRETSFRNKLSGKKFKKILDYILLKFTYQILSDSVIIMSDEAKNSLLKNYNISANKVQVIYNPVDIKNIQKNQRTDVSNNTKKIIATVGRLVPTKNHSLIIHAIKPLIKQYELELWIIGGGPEKSALEKLIIDLELSQNVKLLGHVDNPFEKLSQSTIFVLSSNQEGFPNALLEAMAIGLPVISTKCQSGPYEILKSNEYGLLVPVNDFKAMTEALQSLLKDQTLASYYSHQSIKRVSDFSIKKIIPQYEKVFETVINKSKN